MSTYPDRHDVLQFKLKVPPLRQTHVYRSQTADLLNESLFRKLTILRAPAGFGKTSLVCEWLLRTPCNSVWVSLDETDNDPVRYWNNIVCALEQSVPGYFQRTRAWLESGAADMSDPLLVPLLNELGNLNTSLVLILDDFHAIKSEIVHRTMHYLIRHLPHHVHIVMLTRDAVPFPLGRLKVNRELLMIGKDQLAFNEDETRQLFALLGTGHLPDSEIRELNKLCEGWIAALCLVTRGPAGNVSASLANTLRANLMQIFEYLNEESFIQAEKGLNSFMLRTSIVERMCPELCEALTGSADAHAHLAALERSNFFITLVDPGESWFRYHQLSRVFLQEQLRKQAPDEIALLHEKAANWFASKGLMEEAIHHSLAGSRWDLAAEWIGSYAPVLVQSKRTATIELWLSRIPEKVFPDYPEFSVVRAWTYALLGKTDLALSDLQALSGQLHDVSQASPLRFRQLAVEMHIIKAGISVAKQDLEGTLIAAMKAVPYLPVETKYYPATEEFNGSRLFISRSQSGFWGYLSKSLVLYGGFRDIFEEQKIPLQGYNAAMLAEIAYERNLLFEALHYSELGAVSGYQTKTASVFIPSMLVRIRTMKAIQSAEGFHMEWKRLDKGMRHIGADIYWQDLICAFQIREALKAGTSAGVSEWMKRSRLTERGDLSLAREFEYGTLARILLWQNRLAEAEKLFDNLRELMIPENRYAHLLELDLLRTMLFVKKGELRQAFDLLAKTIELAAPEEYIRLFLDEGPEITRLLIEAAKLPNEHQLSNPPYLALLIKAAHEFSMTGFTHQSASNSLAESLTQRDMNILKCISRGMTNLQIAEKLGLSEGTVKVYNNQLFAKLGVRNRTQALKQAREAGVPV